MNPAYHRLRIVIDRTFHPLAFVRYLLVPALLVALCYALVARQESQDREALALGMNSSLTQTIAQLKSGSQIRLEGDGYVCRTSPLRKEWESAVMVKCAELAALLRTARTGP